MKASMIVVAMAAAGFAATCGAVSPRLVLDAPKVAATQRFVD